jgi:hypothetical protein
MPNDAALPEQNGRGDSSAPSRTDWLYLGLSALAVVASVFKAPRFPSDDSALFEYFGWAMLHGQRLYGDLLDVKLPSIFVVNALWQRLFGERYILHTCAEATVAAATIALFALLLRRWRVQAWALGTFLFAVAFVLPFNEFDFAEHYAVFFIVLGLFLSAQGRNLWAGVALAIATTFWFASALTCIPILLQPTVARNRLTLIAGFAGTCVLYAIAALAAFGPGPIAHLIHAWPERIAAVPLRWKFMEPLDWTIGALVLLLLVAARRPLGAASRFALTWSCCAALGTAIPPNFFESYFLPLTPALSMAIASFGLSRASLLRRPLFAVGALVLVVLATHRAFVIWDAIGSLESNYVPVGAWIRSSIGTGATIYSEEYIPEVYLAAHARMPGPASLLAFSQERLEWIRPPRLLIFGPRNPSPAVRSNQPLFAMRHDRKEYDPVCAGRTGSLILYAPPRDVDAFHCQGTYLMFGTRS